MDIRPQADIPEGINYSRESPLKEFVLLTGGLLLAFFSIVIILGIFADHFAQYVPFSAELKIASLQESNTDVGNNGPMQDYLQRVADRVAAAQHLPADMSVTIHYRDSDVVNAFATLGGRVMVYRGLLEKLHSENALAMVLGHEVAHIKYRHPIRGAGRTAVIGVTLAMFNGAAGNDIVNDVLGEAGLLTALKFSRSQEQQADAAALQAVERLYGHVHGADELFRYLQQEEQEQHLLLSDFYNTHPLTENRIIDIHEEAQAHGWPLQGRLTPLPEKFSVWLDAESEEERKPEADN